MKFRDNPYLLLAVAALFWSGNHIVGRAIHDEVPPLGISAVRWAIPAIALWFLAREHIARDWPAILAHWKVMLWLGVTGGTVFTALQYVGLQYTSALNVSVLNSLVPVLIVASGTLIFRDRITAIQLAGIATSSIGVLAIIAHGDFTHLKSLQFNWGDLIILFNMAAFSVYAACLRLQPKIHWLSFMFAFGAVSSLMTLPFWAWEAASGITFKPTLLTAGAILYVSIFPSLLAFAAWNRGAQLIGAIRSGPFMHLIPIYTAIIASTLLGEHLAIYHVIGFALILAGVWLASHRPKAA
jgi:drug/metabolite transporter (DMT)-like permease